MSIIFTLFYRVNKMGTTRKEQKANLFMGKALHNEFSPSKNTVNSIMAFSNAYHCSKSEIIGNCEQILN